MWTLFNYLYRDASNYKAFGRIALRGQLSVADRNAIAAKFEDGFLFIAEQIDVPVLHEELFRWSDGPTTDDHCWHEWCDFEETESLGNTPDASVWGGASDFAAKVREVEMWRGELSPNFFIGSSPAAKRPIRCG